MYDSESEDSVLLEAEELEKDEVSEDKDSKDNKSDDDSQTQFKTSTHFDSLSENDSIFKDTNDECSDEIGRLKDCYSYESENRISPSIFKKSNDEHCDEIDRLQDYYSKNIISPNSYSQSDDPVLKDSVLSDQLLPSAETINRSPELDLFLKDIKNMTREEMIIINNGRSKQNKQPSFRQTKLTFREIKNKPTENSKNESSDSDLEELSKNKDHKHYYFQKNKRKHQRLYYDWMTLHLLFKKFSTYIKENSLPPKKIIQKYIKSSGSKVLKKAGVEKVYYVLKNKIRKENS